MHKNEVTKKVIKVVKDIQKMSGRTAERINSRTKPVRGIQGFDSLNGVEAAVILSESLGCNIPPENLFVSKDGKQSLSIAEISDRICKIIEEEMDKK